MEELTKAIPVAKTESSPVTTGVTLKASSTTATQPLKKFKAVVINPQKPFIKRHVKPKPKNLTPFNIAGKQFRHVVKNMISPKRKQKHFLPYSGAP